MINSHTHHATEGHSHLPFLIATNKKSEHLCQDKKIHTDSFLPLDRRPINFDLDHPIEGHSQETLPTYEISEHFCQNTKTHTCFLLDRMPINFNLHHIAKEHSHPAFLIATNKNQSINTKTKRYTQAPH
jgi:hypothetical protein